MRERKRSNRKLGELLTRDERWQLRLAAEDLERRLGRSIDPAARARCERGLESIRREQAADRVTRSRGGRKKGGRR